MRLERETKVFYLPKLARGILDRPNVIIVTLGSELKLGGAVMFV